MDLRDFIAKRLDDMLDSGRGPMWGGPEAFELQALLLLELLYFLEDPHSLMPRYGQFIALRYPFLGCRVLSAIISDHNILASELRAFKGSLEATKSGL